MTLDLQYLKSFPKIDLHRHLEGSIRVDTLREVAAKYNIPLPISEDLSKLVQVQKNETHNMENFLDKFRVLRHFYQSGEIIRRLAYEAVADAAIDGISYIEIMFTPVALSTDKHFPLDEVMDWVIDGTQKAGREYGNKFKLIASVNRHENPDLAERVALLAAQRLHNGIAALNLAGNEAQYSAKPFIPIFEQARRNGLGLTVHAGEWGGAGNVQEAILDLKADRIGHGVRVIDDPQVLALAQQKQTLFEVCLSSNLLSGVIQDISGHPIKKMMQAGLNICLNTDDPGVEGVTLSDEFYLAHTAFGLLPIDLAAFNKAAIRASFLTDEEKESLLTSLGKQFDLS